MEVYILDSLYRRVQVVDAFESLIWTERHRASGDFEFVVHSTLENRTRFPVGTRLAMNESYRVMTVKTVEDSTDDEGRATLKISGDSLEHILADRIAIASWTGLTSTTKWTITDQPADIVRKIFHDICVTGVITQDDVILGVVEDSIFPTDTIAEPSETITYSFEPTTVYDAIKNLCDLYDIGFRLVREPLTNVLYFDVYMGSDRTTSQSTLPAVVFSPDLDNLHNTTELTTLSSYKNVAYVVSPVGREVVVATDVDPNVASFERHILLVRADDITDTVPADATAKMIQRGKEELAKHRQFSAFDGELSRNSQYVPGVDYNLGDLVELRNVDGVTSVMQVTEQIYVSDKAGERSYPTLAINTFITPGSWSAWDYNQVWEDMGATEYWADA